MPPNGMVDKGADLVARGDTGLKLEFKMTWPVNSGVKYYKKK